MNRSKILKTEYLGQDKPVNKIDPLVSVCIITYNQAEYIKDCLDNALNQETDFPYEIIVGEDNSTDGTREICIAYAEKYPDKIRLFLRRPEDKIEVQGKKTWHFNFIATLDVARGKFIAWCDGDDYWTDKSKLTIQARVLEDESIVGVHHLYSKLFPNGETSQSTRKEIEVLNTEDIIPQSPVRLCTFMFRNILKDHPLPNWALDQLVGDNPLVLNLSLHGKIVYLNRDMAAHRFDAKGSTISTIKDIIYPMRARIYRSLLKDDRFAFVYPLVWVHLVKALKKTVFIHLRMGNQSLAKEEFKNYLSGLKKMERVNWSIESRFILKYSLTRFGLLKP